jgi:hypothetical protein
MIRDMVAPERFKYPSGEIPLLKKEGSVHPHPDPLPSREREPEGCLSPQ